MKKFYMLLMATLMVATVSAQTAVQKVNFSQKGAKIASTKQSPEKAVRSLSDTLYLSYPMWDRAAWNPQGQLEQASMFLLQTDTLGQAQMTIQGETQLYRPWVYSICQTFDLNSYFYDELLGEGNMSLSASALNIDSMTVYFDYTRDSTMDASIYDTLFIGLALEDRTSYNYFGEQDDHLCFYKFNFDLNTRLAENARVIAVPLGVENVSDGEHYTILDIPVNLTNVTEKVWNVSLTFKRGYDIGVNDILPSHFAIGTAKSQDPDYYVGDAWFDDGPAVDDPYRCDNMSHGGFVWSSFVDYYLANNRDPFYYPSFLFDEDTHFPWGLGLTVSCQDCAVVNVPEIEKVNPTVYPNPATNNFTVNLGNDEKAFIQLFNIVGQQVMSETITGTAQVNVANLNSGVYMLKINQNGKSYTTKVIVK